jgi:hypothetical protein
MTRTQSIKIARGVNSSSCIFLVPSPSAELRGLFTGDERCDLLVYEPVCELDLGMEAAHGIGAIVLMMMVYVLFARFFSPPCVRQRTQLVPHVLMAVPGHDLSHAQSNTGIISSERPRNKRLLGPNQTQNPFMVKNALDSVSGQVVLACSGA